MQLYFQLAILISEGEKFIYRPKTNNHQSDFFEPKKEEEEEGKHKT